MGSKDSNDSMVAVQLTVDLKPDLPSMSYAIVIYSLLNICFSVDIDTNLDGNSYRGSRKN